MILSGVRLPRKAIVGCAVLAACGRQAPPPSDSVVTATDSVVDTTPPKPHLVTGATSHGRLSLLADSIAQRLVFVPTTQDIFTAAARGRRMLVDIGRVDMDVKQPTRLAAYKEAVAAKSPLRLGTKLRLHGRWGADDVEVSGFDVWNGRIVANIRGAPRVDSMARRIEPLVGVAQRTDSEAKPTDTACPRDSVDSLLLRRLDTVRDSLLQVLREGDRPHYPRLAASLKEHSSKITGCFATARGALAVALVGGDYEWVRERVVLMGPDGKPMPLGVRDFRFRAHELFQALDADEDGVDELAARAFTERAGGTVVLRVVEGKRLERVTAGFAYER